MMDTDTLACEQCGNSDPHRLIRMTDPNVLCLECRHEGPPGKGRPVSVSAPPPSDPDPAPASDVPRVRLTLTSETSDDVDVTSGPSDQPDAGDDPQAALDAAVGTTVLLDGGQSATVLGFPDDDHVEVRLTVDEPDGRPFVVDMNDVVRSVDTPTLVADVPDDVAEALARVNATVAALMLQAAIATLQGEAPDYEFGTPPTGWLPDDVETLPAVEQGVAYGAAALIYSLGIPVDHVTAIADRLMTEAENHTSTKGGDNDDNPSDNLSPDSDRDAGAESFADDDDTDPDISGGGDRADSQESVLRGERGDDRVDT